MLFEEKETQSLSLSDLCLNPKLTKDFVCSLNCRRPGSGVLFNLVTPWCLPLTLAGEAQFFLSTKESHHRHRGREENSVSFPKINFHGDLCYLQKEECKDVTQI